MNGGKINGFLSLGKGPIFSKGHAESGHGHGPGVFSKIVFGGTVLVNEANKINDTPGGFPEWANNLFTKHGFTAEAIDLVATMGFIRTVGWARMLAYNSMSEKYLDDNDWSTNLGTKAADWMYGPAMAPKK